jgi:hypothetical protein
MAQAASGSTRGRLGRREARHKCQGSVGDFPPPGVAEALQVAAGVLRPAGRPGEEGTDCVFDVADPLGRVGDVDGGRVFGTDHSPAGGDVEHEAEQEAGREMGGEPAGFLGFGDTLTWLRAKATPSGLGSPCERSRRCQVQIRMISGRRSCRPTRRPA